MNNVLRARTLSVADRLALCAALLVFMFLVFVLNDQHRSHASWLHMESAYSNLEQLNIGINNYSRSHRGILPPMQDADHLIQALYPNYVQSQYAFQSSLDGMLYHTNPSVSGRPAKGLSSMNVAIIYDATATYQKVHGRWENGRMELFYDGKIKWIQSPK